MPPIAVVRSASVSPTASRHDRRRPAPRSIQTLPDGTHASRPRFPPAHCDDRQTLESASVEPRPIQVPKTLECMLATRQDGPTISSRRAPTWRGMVIRVSALRIVGADAREAIAVYQAVDEDGSDAPRRCVPDDGGSQVGRARTAGDAGGSLRRRRHPVRRVRPQAARRTEALGQLTEARRPRRRRPDLGSGATATGASRGRLRSCRSLMVLGRLVVGVLDDRPAAALGRRRCAASTRLISSAKWHAAWCRSPMSRSGGSSVAQISGLPSCSRSQQRVWKRQPDGGAAGRARRP